MKHSSVFSLDLCRLQDQDFTPSNFVQLRKALMQYFRPSSFVREIILPFVRELRPLGIVRCKPSRFCKLGIVSKGEIPYISDKIPGFNHSGCLLINNI